MKLLTAWIFALLASLWPVCVQAQENRPGSWRIPEFLPLSGSVLRGSGAMGDLDGDRRADSAVAQPQGLVNGAYRYRVDVHLSADPSTTFDVDSMAGGGLHISAKDVDGDHNLDLVITSTFGREPIGVWINDGHGRFRPGNADAYAKSIWQETDRCWETPDRPTPSPLAFAATSSGGALKPVRLSVLQPLGALSFAASEDCRVLRALNLGSPFRAPPLS
jgi:hypothetical protein